jgi:predicted Zn-dependent peptidase
LETTGQIASRIAELLVYDLPDDYYADYRDRMRAVTLEETFEAARRCIRPDEMTVVVGGDAEEVQGPLEALEWGPVSVETDS